MKTSKIAGGKKKPGIEERLVLTTKKDVSNELADNASWMEKIKFFSNA